MYFLLSRYLERDAALQNKKPAPPIEDDDRHQWTVRQFEALKQAYSQQAGQSGQMPSSPTSMSEAPPIVQDYMAKMKPRQEKKGLDKGTEEKKAPVKSTLPPKKIPTGVPTPTIKVPDVSRLDPKFVEAYERKRESNPNLPSLFDLSAATKKAEKEKKAATKSIMSEPKLVRDFGDDLEEKTVMPKKKNVPPALQDLLHKQKLERENAKKRY